MVPNFTPSKSGKDSPGFVIEISDSEVTDVSTQQNLRAETAPADPNLRRERLPEKSSTRDRGIVHGGVDQPSALGEDLNGLTENSIDHRRTRYSISSVDLDDDLLTPDLMGRTIDWLGTTDWLGIG